MLKTYPLVHNLSTCQQHIDDLSTALSMAISGNLVMAIFSRDLIGFRASIPALDWI